MRILVVGLGSIGRRHARLLQAKSNIEIGVLRTKKGILNSESEFTEFSEIEKAFDFNPEGVIVANPTSLHVESALPFLKEGCKVLIEKPIAHSVYEAKKLSVYRENLRVAYCMRFLPVANFFRKKIQEENIYSVNFRRSFYLPNWHPYADYRREYTAIKSLGGGVIRTLSHEIDLACSWFGQPTKVVGVVDKLSKLEIDTDDFAFFSLKMGNGMRINIHLDFFSPTNVNYAEAFSEKGKYVWDFNKISLFHNETSKEEILEQNENSIDLMYDLQLDDFISFIRTGKSVNTSYDEALQLLEIIEHLENE